jgi:hypothetical protein
VYSIHLSTNGSFQISILMSTLRRPLDSYRSMRRYMYCITMHAACVVSKQMGSSEVFVIESSMVGRNLPIRRLPFRRHNSNVISQPRSW